MEPYNIWANICIEIFGSRVCDYKINNDQVDLTKVSQDLKPLMVKIGNIPVSLNKDTIVWGETTNCIYLVTSGYEPMQNIDTTPSWDKAWYLGLIPKINIFFWIMLQNHILMVDNLIRRGNHIPNICILRKKKSESVDHMIIHCDFTRQIWSHFLSLFKMNWCFSNKTLELYDQWHQVFKGYEINFLWSWVMSHICWGVWKERNNRIFREKETTTKYVFHKILNALLKTHITSKSSNPLHNKGIKFINRREDCRWTLPLESQFKANFSEAAKGNPGKVGVGAIIRKSHGKVNAAILAPLG